MTLGIPSPERLAQLRNSAELTQLKPYMEVEVAAMQKAVVNSVLSAVNSGTLTPEMAMSKWMEYVAYQKISSRFSQKINMVPTNTNELNMAEK